jgi:hypothetical protein
MVELTKAEKKWVSDVQKVLNKCPSERIGFYTIGDRTVQLYDKTRDDEITDRSDDLTDFHFVVKSFEADISESLEFPSNVHSTAG